VSWHKSLDGTPCRVVVRAASATLTAALYWCALMLGNFLGGTKCDHATVLVMLAAVCWFRATEHLYRHEGPPCPRCGRPLPLGDEET
jgi:hypothetical protein